jgi:phosphoserine aminotransferase
VSNAIKITSGSPVKVSVATSAPNGVQISQGQTTNISIPNVKSVGKSDAHYIHNQTVSTNTWSITHDLAKHPSVTVVDSSDRVVIGQVDYVNNNSLTITFKSAFKGKAYLN